MLSDTTMVSLDSSSESSVTVAVMFFEVCPGVKVRVPEARV